MAVSVNAVWEVRTTGSDTNGGAFVAGATGTDWSQQNAAQYSVTDGVTAGTTTITSVTASFGTDVVGNLIYVSGGTGAVTADRYEIISRTNSTTIVVDRSTGLTAGTGATLKIGGALASIIELANSTRGIKASNKAFVKATAAYVQTATPTFANSVTSAPQSANAHTKIIGYNSIRGDNGRASITLSTNTGLSAIRCTGAGYQIRNFDIDCSSLGTSTGINCNVTWGDIINCKVSNFTTQGIVPFSAGILDNNEVTGGSSAATAAISTRVSLYIGNNNIHDNQCPGILGTSTTTGCTIGNNRIVNNTGASSDGILIVNTANVANIGSWLNILGNTIHGNGRDGIRASGACAPTSIIKKNILSSNGGYGLTMGSAAMPADYYYDGNVYYNNTSGARNNADDITGINAVGAYTNTHDVILTADPYNNAAGGDFTLNNVSGGGRACRGIGYPQSYPGATGTSYNDMGAYQRQAVAFNTHLRVAGT